MTREEIGKMITEERNNRSMTIRQLSEASGVDVGNLSKLEHGKQNFTADTLIRICNAMNVRIRLEAAH